MKTRPPLLDLKAEIVRHGVEFRAFAVAMGWSPSYLSHVLAGRKAMPTSAWPRAAGVLGVRVEDITPQEAAAA
jgi:lambda repressor-like predicted transcriptional regulator